MNNSCKKYYKDLKLLLPLRGKKEKQLFENIMLRLTELNDTNPDISYEDLCAAIGTPQEIVSEYYCNTDVGYLSKNLKFSLYLRHSFLIFIVILLILSGIRIHYLNNAYELIKETNITHEVETIE